PRLGRSPQASWPDRGCHDTCRAPDGTRCMRVSLIDSGICHDTQAYQATCPVVMGAASRFGRDISPGSWEQQQGAVNTLQIEGQLLPGIPVIGRVPDVAIAEAGVHMTRRKWIGEQC